MPSAGATTSIPLGVQEARGRFRGGRGYLAACTLGLPTIDTLAAMRADAEEWALGRADAVRYGAVVERVRSGFADLVNVPTSAVAIGPTAAYRQQILSGGHLGDTDAFRSVIPDAAHASMVLYVNIDDLEHAITQASADDKDIIDNITPLQAIGLSSWMDGEVARTSLMISTN